MQRNIAASNPAPRSRNLLYMHAYIHARIHAFTYAPRSTHIYMHIHMRAISSCRCCHSFQNHCIFLGSRYLLSRHSDSEVDTSRSIITSTWPRGSLLDPVTWTIPILILWTIAFWFWGPYVGPVNNNINLAPGQPFSFRYLSHPSSHLLNHPI